MEGRKEPEGPDSVRKGNSLKKKEMLEIRA